ncbi:hypothetical protein GQ457_18G025180 [Hibiscus cannabinus]
MTRCKSSSGSGDPSYLDRVVTGSNSGRAFKGRSPPLFLSSFSMKSDPGRTLAKRRNVAIVLPAAGSPTSHGHGHRPSSLPLLYLNLSCQRQPPRATEAA